MSAGQNNLNPMLAAMLTQVRIDCFYYYYSILIDIFKAQNPMLMQVQ